jgi:AhpD family alkylhydroperoxidase
VSNLPPDEMVRMMALSPTTARQYVEFARTLLTRLALPAREREMVILTVAATTEADFVAAQHRPIARKAGVDPSVATLIERREYAELDASDRTLVEFVAAVVTGPRVDEELFARLREFRSNQEIVEVLTLTGYYWSFGRIATVLDVQLTKVYENEVLT